MRTTFFRQAAPFSTYIRSFTRSLSTIAGQSYLAPLARGDMVFLALLVRLSDCAIPDEEKCSG